MQSASKSFLEIASIFLAAALPLGQFLFGLLPESLTKLFLGAQFFVATSVIAALLCLLLWLLLTLYPYFRIPLNLVKKWNYDKALRRQDLSNIGVGPTEAKSLQEQPVVYWTIDNTLLPAFILACFAAFCFLYLGINNVDNRDPQPLVTFIQATAYIFWLTASFIILISYNVRRNVQASYKVEDKERAQRALTRAIELNSFSSMPIVRFRGIEGSNAFPVSYVVHVDVGGERYQIGCDTTGEVVHWVLGQDEINKLNKR